MNNKFSIPDDDSIITEQYDSFLKKKILNKKSFLEELELTDDNKTMIMSISSEITDSLFGNIIVDILPGVLEVGIKVIVRGRGTEKYQAIISKIQASYQKQLIIIEDTDENICKMYASTDTCLFLKYNNDTIKELIRCLKYGCVPISVPLNKIEDFNVVEETGNAFIINKVNQWHVFEAIIRAKENFKFPYDWKNIQKTCMATELI